MKRLIQTLPFSLVLIVIFSASLQAQINFTISGVTTATVFNCAVNSITLQATSNFPTPVTYQWANTTSTVTGSMVTLTSAGPYTVTAFSGNFSASQTLSTIADTLPPNLTTSAPLVSLNCYTPSVIMTGSTTTARTDISWIQTGQTTLVQNTLQVQTNTAAVTTTALGVYTVMATNNMNFCTTQSVITVIQNIFPPVAKLVTGNQDPCKTPSVVLTNGSTTGIPNGVFPNSQAVIVSAWVYYGASTQTIGASSALTTPSLGTYGMTVIDLNNGCEASAKTANCADATGLSPLWQQASSFEAYPNPSNGQVTVIVPTKAELHIYTSTGSLQSSYALESGQTELDLDTLPQGLYYCRLTEASGQISTKVVQIVRP